MSDNVILLGAGASFDAGIPLLGNFVECMIQMSQTGRSVRGALTETDKVILKKALDIRDKLETYHARVAIDQFNLEQILSVLAFESYAGSKSGKKDLEAFTRAIATTIELTCNVLHNGKLNEIQSEGAKVYKYFWLNLFALFAKRMIEIPTILSFNYDLVLERSLAQVVIGYERQQFWRNSRCGGILMDFQSDTCESPCYLFKDATWRGPQFETNRGYTLDPITREAAGIPDTFARVPLFKLHGSLNFPSRRIDGEWSPMMAVPDAKIIPPVFNKTDATFASPIWKAGLNALRNCKNLIICGYSLPTSDTYMQYFLKAALGPNRDLNRIYVFDPELFRNGEKGDALRNRYTECFSQALRARIVFEPSGDSSASAGTFAHMVSKLGKAPDDLLFGLLPEQKDSNGVQYESIGPIRTRSRQRFSGL